MNYEGKAATIGNKRGYNIRFDSGTYFEVKRGIAQALKLADQGQYDEARTGHLIKTCAAMS